MLDEKVELRKDIMFYGHVLGRDLRVFTSCRKEDGGARQMEVMQDVTKSRK